MADHDIQKSKQLLKRLEEDMVFMRDLMSELDDFVYKAGNISNQAIYMSSSLKKTWTAINKAHKNWKLDTREF